MRLKGLRKLSERGQVSIMIGAMLSTFLLLLVFVINIGMLVNAKINLQNAADLAAYAGAAVQARQLTHISYLNYEMRRQFKKFLFRIYIMGNMGQDGFPKTVSDPFPGFKPNPSAPAHGGPITCVIFNARDNYCHITRLSAIPIPPSSFIDSITNTLRGQMQALEGIRTKNCLAIGQTNKMLNLFWLFNADPTTLAIENTLPSADQANVIRIIRGMLSGLGLVPREIILRYRIKTLNDYVNSPPQAGVTTSKAATLQADRDPAEFERTIQAFYSAYYTLGNHTFPAGSISMDELTPNGLLLLKDIKAEFKTFAIDFALNAVGGDPTNGQNCDGIKVPIPLANKITLGVYKDPSVLTYYAIRLRAKARLLFSPFGDVNLKAYSAAQPFGSRIGPTEEVAKFAHQTDINGFGTALIPNLPVTETESTAPGAGWDNGRVLGQMYSSMRSAGAALEGLGQTNFERGYQFAMAPNPWEKNKYNIFNDAVVDHFVRNFDTNEILAFWAPVFSPKKAAGTVRSELTNDMKNLFTPGGAGLGQTGSGGGITFATGAVGDPMEALKSAIIEKGLEAYISDTLANNKGENGESANIARLTNPLKFKDPSSPSAATVDISGDPQIIMSNPKQFRTSWNAVNDQSMRNEGRVGYSVKFISFKNLTAAKLPTNGRDTWTNDMPTDPEAQGDIPFLKH